MDTERILIVGGGFAGVNTAVGAVDTLGAAQHRIAVGLVSPSPCWVIKPRLYESDLAGVRVPLVGVLDPLGVVHHQAHVTAIDTAERRAVLNDGTQLRYCQLVLAAASRLALPAGGAVHRVDSYERALELRRAIEALVERESRPRAVVVGGGFTGIEVAAELARDADVTVVASPELAPGYGAGGRAQISQALTSRCRVVDAPHGRLGGLRRAPEIRIGTRGCPGSRADSIIINWRRKDREDETSESEHRGSPSSRGGLRLS